MFLDCADRVITSPSPALIVINNKRTSPEAKNQPTAMVATQERTSCVATLHKDRCPTNLRVVDPFEDEGVWAIVDDGCNSCTHSLPWRLNAEEKWRKQGFKAYLKNAKVTKFTGVGTAPSTGQWRMPAAFKLIESEMVLPGFIDSHEIADSRHPLLFSQSCQAQLGFTKSSRKGTITLDDYEGHGLEVARQAKTGLFMVRIDHLFGLRESMTGDQVMQPMMLDVPDTVDSSDDDDCEPHDHHGYVTVPWRQKKAKKLTEDTLKSDTVIVSCGMMNFESSAYANGSSYEFKEWQGDRRISAGHFTKFPKAKEIFLRSFKKNYPDLVAGRNIIVVTARQSEIRTTIRASGRTWARIT